MFCGYVPGGDMMSVCLEAVYSALIGVKLVFPSKREDA
jgi:pyruvate/2-oxoglutarate/acetoin dehydrogenase E1 component